MTLGKPTLDESMFSCEVLDWEIINVQFSDGSGSKNFDPSRVGLGCVSHLGRFGFELGKFPLKMSNFSIFLLQVKKNIFGLGWKVPRSRAGRPLIYCGSGTISSSVWALFIHFHHKPTVQIIQIYLWCHFKPKCHKIFLLSLISTPFFKSFLRIPLQFFSHKRYTIWLGIVYHFLAAKGQRLPGSWPTGRTVKMQNFKQPLME